MIEIGEKSRVDISSYIGDDMTKNLLLYIYERNASGELADLAGFFGNRNVGYRKLAPSSKSSLLQKVSSDGIVFVVIEGTYNRKKGRPNFEKLYPGLSEMNLVAPENGGNGKKLLAINPVYMDEIGKMKQDQSTGYKTSI